MSNIGIHSTEGDDTFLEDDLIDNGLTPVSVPTLTAASLAQLDGLYIVNPSNTQFSLTPSEVAALDAAVLQGLNVIIFDRYVTNAQTVVPGGANITFVRDFTFDEDVDLAATAPAIFVNGIDNATFDDGSSSSHGFLEASSLPAGAIPLLNNSNPDQIVAVAYNHGSGSVFYSTIPLDFYSSRNLSTITPAEVSLLVGNSFEVLDSINSVDGTAGDDVFAPGDADADGDQINGADGLNDLIETFAGNDTVDAGVGNDIINAGAGDDIVNSGSGDDIIDGGNGDDVITAGIGDDIANGGNGNDRLLGQGGNDTLSGNAGMDMLFGGSGNDTLFGGNDNDTLFGQGNNDILYGQGGDDTLSGGAGSDQLFGGVGDDVLNGSVGADRLDGGAGDDVLNGGNMDGARDTFVFAVGYDQDRVNSFDQAGTDRLELDEGLWAGAGTLTAQQVVDMFGSLNGNGTILTLDFGGGDILEVQSSAGIDAATLGADILII